MKKAILLMVFSCMLHTDNINAEGKSLSVPILHPDQSPEVGRSFPIHWGSPPRVQTKDLRPLPGGFGMGSSTLAAWIEKNIKRDVEKGKRP